MDGHDESVLAEANLIRIEVIGELEPGWSETIEETAAYLARLGKTPRDYVDAWQAFRPSLAAFRRRHTQTRPAWHGHRMPRSRTSESDPPARSVSGGRWFVG
jgi:hypothetical protein